MRKKHDFFNSIDSISAFFIGVLILGLTLFVTSLGVNGVERYRRLAEFFDFSQSFISMGRFWLAFGIAGLIAATTIFLVFLIPKFAKQEEHFKRFIGLLIIAAFGIILFRILFFMILGLTFWSSSYWLLTTQLGGLFFLIGVISVLMIYWVKLYVIKRYRGKD